MSTSVKVINLGLSKLAASRISGISPPKSSLERHCAEGYPFWKEMELCANRWRFALELRKLTPTEPTSGQTDPERSYAYSMPNDALRPVRQKSTDWVQRGAYLWSRHPELTVEFVINRPESQFDPMFADVLACRVAVECAELITQSNSKKAEAKAMYADAVKLARKTNSMVAGSGDVSDEEDEGNAEAFSWVTNRWVG